MPSNTVPGFLVDAYGRQAVWTGGGGGVLHQRSSDDDRLRPRPANHFADYISLLSPSNYRELTSECRAIGSRGVTSALIDSKTSYVSSSGFAPQFTGSDSNYGAEVMVALKDALQICNIRGPRFDWRTTWGMGVRHRATDGSYFVLLTSWGDTGWPAIQVLEGHRIGQRDWFGGIVGANDAFTTLVAEDGSTTRVKGAYVGLRIYNGVIYNRAGTEVAYRVLGATKEKDEDISARDMIHVARPTRHSEGRPAPEMATAILDFLAIDLAQTCQLDQQIQDARINLIETNATGKYDEGMAFKSQRSPSATPAGTPTEVVERGMTRIVKSGFDVKAHEASRPSDQWMNFDWRVLSRASSAIRWSPYMLDPEKLGGVAGRAFQDQINTYVQDDFLVDAPAAIRVLRYFNAKLTQLGVVRKHAEWQKLTVAAPTYFEVDRASAKLDLEDVAAGRQSISTLHARDGTTSARVFAQNADAFELAEAEFAKRGGKVPIEFIRGDWGRTAQRTGEFQTGKPQEEPAPDDQRKPLNV